MGVLTGRGSGRVSQAKTIRANMKVTFKTLDQRSFEMEVGSEEGVEDLICKMEDKLGQVQGQVLPPFQDDRRRAGSADQRSLPLRQARLSPPHLRRYGPCLARRSRYLA